MRHGCFVPDPDLTRRLVQRTQGVIDAWSPGDGPPSQAVKTMDDKSQPAVCAGDLVRVRITALGAIARSATGKLRMGDISFMDCIWLGTSNARSPISGLPYTPVRRIIHLLTPDGPRAFESQQVQMVEVRARFSGCEDP